MYCTPPCPGKAFVHLLEPTLMLPNLARAAVAMAIRTKIFALFQVFTSFACHPLYLPQPPSHPPFPYEFRRGSCHTYAFTPVLDANFVKNMCMIMSVLWLLSALPFQFISLRSLGYVHHVHSDRHFPLHQFDLAYDSEVGARTNLPFEVVWRAVRK